MTEERLSKRDLQHIMVVMNGWSAPDCEECDRVRKKLEKIIAEYPDTTQETISGHAVTVERGK